MAIYCPHCNEPMNSGAETRFSGSRWHSECWIPWLEASLEAARAEEARYQAAEEKRQANTKVLPPPDARDLEEEATRYRLMLNSVSAADRDYTAGKLRCD